MIAVQLFNAIIRKYVQANTFKLIEIFQYRIWFVFFVTYTFRWNIPQQNTKYLNSVVETTTALILILSSFNWTEWVNSMICFPTRNHAALSAIRLRTLIITVPLNVWNMCDILAMRMSFLLKTDDLVIQADFDRTTCHTFLVVIYYDEADDG